MLETRKSDQQRGLKSSPSEAGEEGRRGLDPYAYLREVLTRLPRMTNRQIPEVTPAAWADVHY